VQLIGLLALIQNAAHSPDNRLTVEAVTRTVK